jgi:hypothetical protein
MSKLAITFIITTVLAIYVFTQSNNIDAEVDGLVQNNHGIEEQDLDQLEDVVGNITPNEDSNSCFSDESGTEINCKVLIGLLKEKINTHTPRTIEQIIMYREKILNIKRTNDIEVSADELLKIEELSIIELEQVSVASFNKLDHDQKEILLEKHGGVEYLQFFYVTNLLPPEDGRSEVQNNEEYSHQEFDQGMEQDSYNQDYEYDEYEVNMEHAEVPQYDNYRDVASDSELEFVEEDLEQEEFLDQEYQQDNVQEAYYE